MRLKHEWQDGEPCGGEFYYDESTRGMICDTCRVLLWGITMTKKNDKEIKSDKLPPAPEPEATPAEPKPKPKMKYGLPVKPKHGDAVPRSALDELTRQAEALGEYDRDA